MTHRKLVPLALKLSALALLAACFALAWPASPAAAHSRVSVGVSIGVPIDHDGWGHGRYYHRYGHYPRYGRYHYGHYRYGHWRPYVYAAPIVVVPYPRRVYPAPVYHAPVAPAPAGVAPSYCREFRTTININGTLQPAWGTACLQPDGTWRFVQ